MKYQANRLSCYVAPAAAMAIALSLVIALYGCGDSKSNVSADSSGSKAGDNAELFTIPQE